MWIVRLALRRPYTFLVLALVMMLAGGQVVRKTPTDIFPAIDLPVLSVVWTYTGLPAGQMEQQITQFSEYSLAGNVGDVQRIESQTLDGVSVIRLFLQPGADVAAAMAQVTAGSQAILRRMPPGTQPPIVVRYSASSVPILQIAFTSDTLSEAEIFDHVNTRIRTLLSVVRGTRFPLPMGGRFRQISVDLDLGALQAQGLSPNDVALAVSAQNLTLPTGSAKIGDKEYRVSLNSEPRGRGRAQRRPHHEARRAHDLPARRRVRARRVRGADQHRAARRQARRRALGAQDRRRLDHRGRRSACARCCPPSAPPRRPGWASSSSPINRAS